MGIKAYNRGSRVIARQLAAGADARAQAYAEGCADARDEARGEIARLRFDLARAKRALRLEALKLQEERRRAAACVDALEVLRAEFRGQANRAAYVAITAVLRARRALGR